MVRLSIGKNDIQGKLFLPYSYCILTFRSTEPFDWYQVYGGIKDVISQHINKNDKILNVGAGNSRKKIS